MRKIKDRIVLSPSDLSNHLGCKHLTQLERQAALGKLNRPEFNDPSLAALYERGLAHEKAYVEYLKQEGKSVLELPEYSAMKETIDAMSKGVEVIVQPTLSNEYWSGRADILLKVNKASKLGGWSYEVLDTKLAVETKAGTILQLSVYSDIISEIQGITPEYMYVVKPGSPFSKEPFRYDDFKAYYKQIKNHLIESVNITQSETYPEPVDQCQICRWWNECNKKRHDDDYLSLIANIRKTHIEEIKTQGIRTLESFARLDKPLPNKPERGKIDTYQTIHDQAKIQFKGRNLEKPIYELLPVIEEKGFNRLPEPNTGDIYFDFEGDPFYHDGGLEYLFGITYWENNKLTYKAWWALTRADEKKAFDDFMNFVTSRGKEYPGMHIYHYSPYETSAIKRLGTRHAIHEDNVSDILRSEKFTDLYSISKEILRASVESYSIKSLEKLADYERKCKLELAGPARRTLEYILEFEVNGIISPETKQVVQDYNEDDCRATAALHLWLEKIRKWEVDKGVLFTRPEVVTGEVKEKTSARIQARNELFDKLISGLPLDNLAHNEEQKAIWLLAHMVHYHYREDKNHWWQFHTVHEMEPELLLDEKSAITGLTLQEKLPKVAKQQKPRFRYTFPLQPISSSIKPKTGLFEVKGDKKKSIGTLEEIDRANGNSVIMHNDGIVLSDVHVSESNSKIYTLEASLHAVINEFQTNGFKNPKRFKAANDLLFKFPPDLQGHTKGNSLIRNPEGIIDEAIGLASAMNETVLAIQGPPGTGKTYIGAKMVLALVLKGKKVGITAVSHKVIQSFLEKVYAFAEEDRVESKVRFIHKNKENENCPPFITEVNDINSTIDHIQPMTIVGATAYLWADDRAVEKLEYLFVDEAGQMSLANVLAASRATKNLILLGDPQQLEQPQKGSHPEGSDVSALTHLLGINQTIADHLGIFLGTTYRLHPDLALFTSELYYDNKLHSKDGLSIMSIAGDTTFAGSGLFYHPVQHRERQTHSDEEVVAIKNIVADLLNNNTWTNDEGKVLPITAKDILIVAPYNDQVNALKDALPKIHVGTVDKFQGQEAAIVIYSITCSSANDAPRGMSFLYSPNRLNVATSRAHCICILVGTEEIFQVECRSIDQMKWANAFCRFKEMAREATL